MRRSVAIAVCGLLLLSGAVLAGKLETSRVSAKAKWVVHLDVQGMLASQFGQDILKEIEARGKEKDIAAFTGKAGFDPTKDLRGITLWGETYEADGGVGVIDGKFDREKLLGLLTENAGHREAKHGDYTLKRWTQKPENALDDGVRWGTFWSDDVVLITRDQKILENAIDTLKNSTATMAGRTGGVLAREASKGAFLGIAGTEIKTAAAAAKRPELAKKLSAGFAELGEVDGTMFLSISVTAVTETDGEEFRQMLQGMLAFAKMSLRNLEENEQPLPHWAPFVRAVTVGGTGGTVSISVKLPTAVVIPMMKAAEEAKKAAAKQK